MLKRPQARLPDLRACEMLHYRRPTAAQSGCGGVDTIRSSYVWDSGVTHLSSRRGRPSTAKAAHGPRYHGVGSAPENFVYLRKNRKSPK